MSYKFNAFTRRFDLDSSQQNFSIVDVTEDVRIEYNQQMLVQKKLKIHAKLSVAGNLVFQDKFDQSLRVVTLLHQQSRVDVNTESFVSKLTNRGSLKILGKIVVGKAEMNDFVPYIVLATEQLRVNRGKQAVVFGKIQNQGNIKIFGKLKFK